jgi:hypothetical protein
MTSLFQQVKNNVVYQIHKNLTSPEANEFVKQGGASSNEASLGASKTVGDVAAPSSAVLSTSTDNATGATSIASTTGATGATGAASTASTASTTSTTSSTGETSTWDKIYNQITKIGSQLYVWTASSIMYIMATIFASLIANEMIMYTWQIRLAFFIFTFLICIIFTQVLYYLFFYYLLKGLFHKYKKSSKEGGVMPTWFALLPLTTNQYEDSNPVKRAIMWFFTYTGNEKKKEKLLGKDGIMDTYWNELNQSIDFTQYDEYALNEKKAETFIKNMHTYDKPAVDVSPPRTMEQNARAQTFTRAI